jgi:hypothetical protein
MVGLLPLLLLTGAPQAPQVAVSVDRDRIAVGEAVTLTVIVRAVGSLPVEIEEPQFGTAVVLDRREHSQVSVEDGTRTTRREILIRPERPGTIVIGPFLIRQEETVVESEAVTVVVTGAVPTVAELSPRIRSMIEGAIPRADGEPDEVEVAVLTSGDSVMLGEQIDLVVTAWFPRDVRNRLRAPPTVLPPDVRGAWGYAQPTPGGIAASRSVDGRTFDLFVYHEIVFALTVGDLEVGPATVSYSLPVSGSFLSREMRYEEQSTAFLVTVSSPPNRQDARGVPGRDMALSVEAPETELPLGDAVSLSLTLSGRGNVALWPEPELLWPAGLQAYQQRAAVQIIAEDGVLGGTKLFEYLVVADSAGFHRLPPPRYRYFDLAERRYVTIEAAPVVFATPAPSRPAEPVRAPPRLLAPSPWHGFDPYILLLPPWLWTGLVAVPPLVVLLVLARRRRPRPSHSADRHEPVPDDDRLAALEAEFRRLLQRLVPASDALGGDRLAAALVAAGVESSLAAHATRVRDRLRSARYGPDPGTDREELAQEVHAVRAALTTAGQREWRTVAGAALVLLAILPMPLEAQSVDELWQAGAVRPVVDSLDARTRGEPSVAAHWYNLGLALEQLGLEARARAAWLRAARLSPRIALIRRAVHADDGPVGSLLWVAPVTPLEGLAGAAFLWVGGWILFVSGRRRVATTILAGAIGLAAFAGVVEARYRIPVGFVVSADTPLREAPYGPAPSSVSLDGADAVRIERAEADWRLVTRGQGRGWLHATELVEY